MRVISGSLRGLKLNTLSGEDTRPTLDRVKEALFSMLFDRVADSCALDLFAGSGALGIEQLSRYGRECTFVDSSREAISVINGNIRKARLDDRARVVHSDALSFAKTTMGRYDLIFIDPPYDGNLYKDVLCTIRDRELLSPGGVIVCECRADYNLPLCGFSCTKDKTYGKVRLVVLEEA